LNAYVPEEVTSILHHDYKTNTACAAIATDDAVCAIACTASTTTATSNASTACSTVYAYT
jgi:hypothetical protein